jgi:hypothetical protein
VEIPLFHAEKDLKNRNYRFYVAKYPLTPAFMLGIKKTAELGFSHEFICILFQIFRAKAQKSVVLSPSLKAGVSR